jgi:predicted dehydrogenase
MLDLAIVGAGIMGTNHARVARAVRDARVAVVVDPDARRGRALADAVGCAWAPSLEQADGSFDGAVVAAPNELHEAIATELAAAGIGMLVEKPLAPSAEAARRIHTAAEKAGVVLAVGHVERFNPAVLALDMLLDDVIHVSAARISPYSDRIDHGVVIDLMIHDLDIVQSVARGRPARLAASTQKVRSRTEDLATAIIEYEGGMTADLIASRIGQQKIRQLQITQRDSFVVVDLVRQDVTLHRVEHSEFLSAEGARYRQSGVVEIPYLEHRGEPLFLQLEQFVRCLQGDERPRVDGAAGTAAVEACEAVLAAAAATR